MANIDKIKEELNKLTILEVSELVKALEAEWGVSAAAPVAMVAPGAGAAAAAGLAGAASVVDVLEVLVVAGELDVLSLLEPPSLPEQPTDPASTITATPTVVSNAFFIEFPLRAKPAGVECRSEPVATWKRSPGGICDAENRCAATDVESSPGIPLFDGYAGAVDGDVPGGTYSPPPPRALNRPRAPLTEPRPSWTRWADAGTGFCSPPCRFDRPAITAPFWDVSGYSQHRSFHEP